MRGVCGRAGVATRYFYESFADRDDFVRAVFDQVIAELATTTQAAVSAAPPQEQTRAGMTNIVRTIVRDPRIGRLVFAVDLADPVLVHKRAESGALFAMLSGQYAGQALRLAQNERMKATAHFVVGGVAQSISAWLSGEVTFTPNELVDQLTLVLNQLGDPALYGP